LAFLVANGAKWQIAHYDCKPSLAKELQDKGKALVEKEKAQLEAECAKMAAAKALKEKLGIDFDGAKCVKSAQLAWSDEYDYEASYSGEGTDDDFRQALYQGEESSYGALRWSGGRKLNKLDRDAKIVGWHQSIRLAD
jgi:hypothetical protein